jgi:hypothetical protein
MGKMERKLEEAAAKGATNEEIDEIGNECLKKAVKMNAPGSKKEKFVGCVLDKLDELNEDLE